jgi:hypothetical protein
MNRSTLAAGAASHVRRLVDPYGPRVAHSRIKPDPEWRHSPMKKMSLDEDGAVDAATTSQANGSVADN